MTNLLQSQTDEDHPNILFIISDDLGADATNGYLDIGTLPTTPNLDALSASGLTFKNAWATPRCTPSRATIMSGKYGIKTGIRRAPGNLDVVHASVFTSLGALTNEIYSDAVIGKWHISQPANPNHPLEHNIDYYYGNLNSGVDDYFNWAGYENGVAFQEEQYATSAFTDKAIDWINVQNQPWFLWLAHVAPHAPFHRPPDSLFSGGSTNNNFRRYLAMIEAMDTEIGRLLSNIPEAVLDNTVVIYIGDNGTPRNFVQGYPEGHGKSTLYEGGVHVPLIVSGKGVSRMGETEEALVHATDIYATILEIAGVDLSGGIYNSLSFKHLLSGVDGPRRDYNYTDYLDEGLEMWAIRNERYKLIEDENGVQEFFDLLVDSLEFNNLMLEGLTMEQQAIVEDFQQEVIAIRTSWSCRDKIQNGDESGIDCGGSSCTPCVTTALNDFSTQEEVQIFPNPGRSVVTIQTRAASILDVKIYNVLGQVVWEAIDVNSKQTLIDLGDLEPQLLNIAVQMEKGWEINPFVKLQ